jgi:prepilin-type N-terminal cleavage/methylation domain-containing protein
MIRRVRSAMSSEKGFTLTELLVAIVVMGVILAMVVGFFSSASKAFTQNQTISGNTRAASNGMNEISRILRAATQNPVQGQPVNSPAFVTATNESVTVYAYVNLTSSTEQPVKVQFSIDSNRNLVETQWASYVIASGYWGYAATPSFTRILASSIVNRVAPNPYLFTYLAADGTTIPIPTGGFTTTNLSSIAAVQVNLTIGKTANASSTVSLENTVGLPNLAIARTS